MVVHPGTRLLLGRNRSFSNTKRTPSPQPHPQAPASPPPTTTAEQQLVYTVEFLQQQARWIRDDLDVEIARGGPDALHSDDLLRVDEFLRRLLTATNIHVDTIRTSRIHLAIRAIAARATRWPKRLIDRCEALEEAWTKVYGPLGELGIALYGPGGRLFNICQPDDLSKEHLIVKWLKMPGVKLNMLKARRPGDMGFVAGSWWINTTFAFLAGIIDSSSSDGGITTDVNGAYAVLMTGEDELQSVTPDIFTYRARSSGRGRYRLTAGTLESRNPVRILRSHSLRSFWSPLAGVRYDGLHRVVGWVIKQDRETKQITYDITFQRLSSELDMDLVLCRPWTEEVEDYKEYKRLRYLARQQRHEQIEAERARSLQLIPPSTVDGIMEVYEDDTAETPFQHCFSDQLPSEFEEFDLRRRALREMAQ